MNEHIFSEELKKAYNTMLEAINKLQQKVTYNHKYLGTQLTSYNQKLLPNDNNEMSKDFKELDELQHDYENKKDIFFKMKLNEIGH